MVRTVRVSDCELYYTRITLAFSGEFSIKPSGGGTRLNAVLIYEGEDPMFTICRETSSHPPFSKLRRRILGVSMEILSGRHRDYTYVSPMRRSGND